MKKALAVCIASSLLAAAGPVAPQSPAPAPERPATAGSPDLKADQAAKLGPRITFDPRDLAGMASEQSAGSTADGLPSLGGGKPARPFDAPSGSGGKVPYPKDMNPGMR